MKRVLFVFALVLLAESSFAVAFSFRVQCSTNETPDFLEVYNRIPERQSYILPTGSTMYFSGAYFNEYESAKERLDEVRELGISSAFIRVFKSSRFLSRDVSEVLLKELLAKKESDRLLNNGEKESGGKSKLRTMSRKELVAYRNKKSKNKTTNSRVDYKDIELPSENKQTLSSTSGRSNKLKVKTLKNADNFKVTEAPVFKILIGKTTGSKELPETINTVDELVYENKEGNNNYFTIGFYSSKKEAKKALNGYRSNPENKHFKTVSFYQGRLISNELAKNLQERFASQNKIK